MEKRNTGILITGIILLALAGGGFGIYTWLKKRRNNQLVDPQYNESPIDFTQVPSVLSVYDRLPVGSFPLKKGSINKLTFILQYYINCKYKAGLTMDGKFGDGTEKAVEKYLGVRQINSKEQLYSIIASKGPIGACEAMAKRKFDNI